MHNAEAKAGLLDHAPKKTQFYISHNAIASSYQIITG